VCADDYAFTPAVSRSIRELLAARRISATSVMAASEFWPREAEALKAVAGDADIGLHVTLTDQTPLGRLPALAPHGRFPPMGAVFKAGLLRRLPLAEIGEEIERQLDMFIRHYGRPPAHIDGHHHVQQLPGVRDIVVGLAARVAPGRTWVRCGWERAALIRARGVASGKAHLIGMLGRGVARRAAAKGVPVNSGFSGAYDFSREQRSCEALFARFIRGAGDRALLMCHPGHSDDLLRARDTMTDARDREHAFLGGDAWPRLLAAEGLAIAPYHLPLE
jgi:hypothetical protein